MKFNTRQIIAALIAINLIWVFVGCAFLCAEIENCASDVGVLHNVFKNIDEPPHEESCPITTSARMTAPERILLRFETATIDLKHFANFSLAPVSTFSSKSHPIGYPPPRIVAQNKRPFILRI